MNAVRCPGSGTVQMLDWWPDDKPAEGFPRGYPGAAVCGTCSYGVPVVRGSAHKMTGFEGMAGRLRVHWVDNLDNPGKMAYTKKGLRT